MKRLLRKRSRRRSGCWRSLLMYFGFCSICCYLLLFVCCSHSNVCVHVTRSPQGLDGLFLVCVFKCLRLCPWIACTLYIMLTGCKCLAHIAYQTQPNYHAAPQGLLHRMLQQRPSHIEQYDLNTAIMCPATGSARSHNINRNLG